MTIETLVADTFHTAEADIRCQAADAEFLFVFMSLKGEARAARWRGLDNGAKFRLVARRIEQLGMDWMPSDVEAQIAKYDVQYAAGPVEAAVEGALERLALENADHARAAGPKADRTHFRRNATAYTNALDQYRKGVRPEVLASGARLVPSSTPGKAAHLITMDGDWVCTCCAGASMHWPIALVIGIEVAHDDMQTFDDPPGENPLGDEEGDELPAARGPNPIPHAEAAAAWLGGRQLLAERLRATAQYIETLRAAQRPEAPTQTARRLGVRLVQARKRSAYFTSAFYLEAA